MDKIKILEKTRLKLKSDFVGIDKIIDQVLDDITPWYLTPEILERPVTISLWGLTGTGKTSLIRKLINYLNLSGKTLIYDCGEQGGGGDSRLFSQKLDELFESSQILENDIRYSEEELTKLGIDLDPSARIERTNPLDFTFVFDEFQYLNSKNSESGEEISRPEARAIWGLMDSGMIDINEYNYKISELVDYIEDMEVFSETYPDVNIKDCKFPKEYSSILKQQVSYYRWAGEDEKETEKMGFKVLFDENFSFLIKRLNLIQKGLGFKVGDKLKSFTKLSDFVSYIRGYIEIITKPKVINCSRSLIFVLGNLDEAFNLGNDDLDPDIDADVYHEITSRVNLMDIKTALRRRFRDEQVGRLGNNIIIYPSLRRCDFEEVIEKELGRIQKKFKESHGVDINFSDNFKKLIYQEGCYPIQGVRPLFSTINSLVSPLLSSILLSVKKDEMKIDVTGDNFNVSKVDLVVDALDGERIGKKEMTLNLGALRSPERCKKLGLQAVHEASHAVLYKLCTGKNPSAIIASNIFGDGGYMMHEVNLDSSVTSREELKNDIIVSLAGYYGERCFFKDHMCSLGASSDIRAVWEMLRDAFYKSGFHTPMAFSEKSVSSQNDGLPYGFPIEDRHDIQNNLYTYFEGRVKETKKYIEDEKYLIAKVSEYLLSHRSMTTEVFIGYVEKYGKTFKDHIRESDNYYVESIKDVIYEEEKIDKQTNSGI